jgi:hypothetical protein
MQSIFNTRVLFLPNKESQSLPGVTKTATLAALLLSETWRAQVEAVRAETDPARQQALKDALPVFLPSLAEGSTLRPQSFRHSGFVVLDLDAKDNPDIDGFDRLKEEIGAVPYVAYCGRSCRGRGWLLIVPITDPSRHREIYRALLSDFQKIGLRLDPSCINLNRLRFVSYDPAPYVNTAAVPYGKVLPTHKKEMKETAGRLLTDAETDAKVREILDACDADRLDITGNRAQWIKLLISFANTYGEAGRDYAHRLSSHYPGYSHEETDREFSDLLGRRDYETGIGTFFYIARQELGRHIFDAELAKAEEIE